MSKDTNNPDGSNPFEGASEDPTQVFQAPAEADSTQSFPTTPASAYAPQAPYSSPAGQAPRAYPSAAPTTKTLSNVIAFAALGVMAFIAAVGLMVFFGRDTMQFSGQAILISVGLIVVVAGAVLIYAAMKGQRAGWFLPFTIVGALIAVPVAAIGGAMTAYSYVDNSPGLGGSWTDEDWTEDEWEDFAWEDEDFTEDWETDDVRGAVRTVDPTQTSIIGTSERLLLNLTEIDDVHDLEYKIALNNSEMTVLLTEDQLPLIPVWTNDDSSWFEGEALLPFSDDDIAWQLGSWVDNDFNPEMYPFGLGQDDEDPDVTIYFDISLTHNSAMRFVIVDEDVMGHWSPMHPADQGAQSGNGPHHGKTPGTSTEKNDGDK